MEIDNSSPEENGNGIAADPGKSISIIEKLSSNYKYLTFAF